LLFAAVLVLPASTPAAGATQANSHHIRVGLVRDTATDAQCGISLRFSRDFKAGRYGRYGFKLGGVTDMRSDPPEFSSYAVMHLDDKDRFFTRIERQRHLAADGSLRYETLKLWSDGYRLDIKWLPFDLCSGNEDCEIEGRRAYITIHRGDDVRHLRLFGAEGC